MSAGKLVASTSVILILMMGLGVAPARAGLLYSIDKNSDDLVTIDSTTGHVQVVGSLGSGFDAIDVDLAMHAGKLYGVIRTTEDAALWEISCGDGSATRLGYLQDEEGPVTHAEGLTSSGGKLLVSFTTDTGDHDVSNNLGELSSTGMITNDEDIGVDMDGLGAHFGLWALDVISDNNRIYRFEPPPPTAIGQYSILSDGRLNDLDFVDDTLYGISNETFLLHEISTVDGSLLGVVPLDRAGAYHGLAPEPTSLTLLTLGSIPLLRRRRSC